MSETKTAKYNIQWTPPIMGSDHKYSITGFAKSSLGVWVRVSYYLALPDKNVVGVYDYNTITPELAEAITTCCNRENAVHREVIEEEITRKLDQLENGFEFYGMTHWELAALSIEEREAKIVAWNEKQRATASATWSAELRQKIAVSEVMNRQRLPSVVIEHDLDDEPWRTW